MIRSTASEPILILSDQDYRRAFSPPARKTGRMVVGVVLVAAVAAAWWAREKPRPAAPPLAAAPAPRPRAVPPPVPEPAPAPPVPPVAVVSAPPEEVEPPAEVEPAPRPAPRAPWCGGRAWVQFRLRMEVHAQVQECERRVVVVEEGSRYLVERPSDGSRDPWLDRLELLLQPPEEDENRRRQVTRTRNETLHLRNADLVCRVVEGRDRFPQGDRRFRYWTSDEFPIGTVQAEETLGDLVFACRVVDFGPAPSRKP